MIDAAKVRVILEAKRSELRALLARRDGTQVERVADPIDAVQPLCDREAAALQLGALTRMLRAVEAAIARLADGTYGICEACEEEIPEPRLRAIPWASLCVGCQQEAELRAAAAAVEWEVFV